MAHKGALHRWPWIQIRCRSGIRIQRPLCLHKASIRIRAACCAAWQCAGTVREIQSSIAMVVVCLRVKLKRDHIVSGSRIRISVNPVSVPVWRAPNCVPHSLVLIWSHRKSQFASNLNCCKTLVLPKFCLINILCVHKYYRHKTKFSQWPLELPKIYFW